MAMRGISGRVVRALAIGLAIASMIYGLSSATVEAREFKLVKLNSSAANYNQGDFADGCAIEGGLLNEKKDSSGNVVESGCTMTDGSAVDCDWGTRECRLYPPKVASSATHSGTRVDTVDAGTENSPTSGTTRRQVSDARVVRTPVAER